MHTRRGRAKRFFRGLLRWTLRGVAGLLVLVVTLVLVLLYSNAALRLAVRHGLGFYNARIPGEIAVADVEGRLGTEFVLRGVSVVDRVGRPLVTADALRVAWSPWSLLRGELALAEVELVAADVFLFAHEDGSAFTDLAIPGPDKPEEPRKIPGVGPDLPLDITVGALRLTDVDVYRGSGLPLAEETSLVVTAHAVGQAGELEILEGAADLPGSRILGLGLAARWTDPVVAVTAHVDTNLGKLTLERAEFDAEALAGNGRVAVIGDREGLADRTEEWLSEVLRAAPSEPLLTLAVRGSADDLSAELDAVLPGALAAGLTVAGKLTDGPRLFATVRARADLERMIGARVGVVQPVVSAALTGDPDWQGLRAEVDVRCEHCGPLSDAGLWATALQEPTEVRARVAAQLAGVSLTGSASFEDGTYDLRAGELDLTIADVKVPLAVGRSFAEIPEIGGGVAVHGLCNGEPLLCMGDVSVTEFAGFGARLAALGVAARGQPFGPTKAADAFVTLEDLAIKGQRVAGAEAYVTLGPVGTGALGQGMEAPDPEDRSAGPGSSPRQAVADGSGAAVGHQVAQELAKGASRVGEDNSTIREQVATSVAQQSSEAARSAGSGIPPLEVGIEVEAWMKRRDRGDRARVLARVRPGPPLEVDVDGLSVHLRGLMALLLRPTHVRVDGERIAVRGLDLKAADGRIKADGVVDRGGRSDFDVDIEGVRLDTVARAVPALRRRLGGTVGLHAHLEGSAHDPTLYVRADGRKLWFQATEIGDVDVGVDLKERDATATVTVVGPLADRAAVKVDTRLLADLKRGKFGLLAAQLSGDVDVAGLRLGALRPWLSRGHGVVDVHAAVRGTAERPVAAVRVSARDLALDGWKGEGARVVANAAYANGALHGDVDVLHLEAGARLVIGSVPVTVDLVKKTAEVRWDEPIAATLAVRKLDLWRQLTALDPQADLAGLVELDVAVRGTGARPEVEVAVDAERLRVREADLGSLQVKAGYADERVTLAVAGEGGLPGVVSVRAAAPIRVAPAKGEVAWLKDQAHELDVEVARLELAGLRRAGVDAPVRGTVGVRVKGRGSAVDPDVTVGVEVKNLFYRTMPVGSVQTTVNYGDELLAATVKGHLGARTKVDGEARVPLAIDLTTGKVAWDRKAHHEVHLGLEGVDRATLLPLGAPIPADALIGLGLQVDVKGGLEDFVGDVEMHGQLGHKVFGGAPVHLSVHAEPKSQRARFALGSHIITEPLEVRAAAQADIPGLVAGTAKAKDIRLTASARSNGVDLRYLKAFTPPGLFDPIGKVTADATVHGTLGAPRVQGRVGMRDGGITVLALQQRFYGINLDVTAKDRHVEVESLVVRGGNGTLSSSAKLDIGADGALKLVADATISKFPLARPGLPQMQIDGKVKARVASDAEGTDVDVTVANTEVLVTGYSVRAPKAIPDNVNVRGKRGELVRPIDVKQFKKEQKAAAGEVDPRTLALKIKLADPIRFTGPVMQMEWSGAIAVDQSPEAKSVTGKLKADEGKFDLLGNRFVIESGEVTLPEGEVTIDPFLNVVAATQTEVARVRVTIRGRASRPQLIFSSEPSLPQQQILTLLVTGTTDASEANQQKVLAEAATLLVLAENPALANFITRSTGLDYVGVSFGDSATQPILTIGKHVNRKIYAETSYKHNAPMRANRVEASVEYELTPRWTIETFFGDAAVGGVDLWWRKLFGAPRPPPPPKDRSKVEEKAIARERKSAR